MVGTSKTAARFVRRPGGGRLAFPFPFSNNGHCFCGSHTHTHFPLPLTQLSSRASWRKRAALPTWRWAAQKSWRPGGYSARAAFARVCDYCPSYPIYRAAMARTTCSAGATLAAGDTWSASLSLRPLRGPRARVISKSVCLVAFSGSGCGARFLFAPRPGFHHNKLHPFIHLAER